MSNFKILYPDKRLTTSPDTNTNLLFGSRSDIFQKSVADTTFEITFDVGEAIEIDYLYIARADLIARRSDDDINILIEADDNDSFTSPESITESYNLTNLKNNDYILSITSFTTSYRYYRITFTSNNSILFAFSKIWIGKSFEFRTNPEKPIKEELKKDNYHHDYKLKKEYRLQFPKITDTQRKDFYSKILKVKQLTDFVFWDSEDEVFTNVETLKVVSINDAIFTPYSFEEYDLTLIVEDSY